jgi:hypothetical protein
MSVNPIWTVHCDGGGIGCHGWTAEEETKKSARKTAKARGWRVGHRDGTGWLLDYCPPCRRARGL